MKIARFVLASQELFYFVTGLTMLVRHCASVEEAERIIHNTGVTQVLFQV